MATFKEYRERPAENPIAVIHANHVLPPGARPIQGQRAGFVSRAIAAGIDVLCFGNNLTYDPDIARKAIAILVHAVERGDLSEARIDISYRRVLALKRRAGLIT